MSIVVNKGRIHGELMDFLRTIWNMIKSDKEMWWEIREIYIFRKNQRQIHVIKNYRIWIKIRGEINEWSRYKFSKEKIVKNWNWSWLNLWFKIKI